MKKIWLTSLGESPEDVKPVLANLKKYGLAVDGHLWQDDLEKLAWTAPRKEIINTSVGMWVILCSQEDLTPPSVRYGLSLLVLSVQAQRGLGFPIILLDSKGKSLTEQCLPATLGGNEILDLQNPAYAAKIVAKLHKTPPVGQSPYRLDVHAIPQVGQWFEVGPKEETWPGMMFGAAGAEISFHAVGTAGALPEKSTLRYPQKGLEIELQEKSFRAWAVQNDIDPSLSYYIKVEGQPDTILFGPFTADEDPELFVLDLK
jgi:hypothetical protein